MNKRQVRLVSLNLWRFNDWEVRLPRIISLLKEINADIVFLQEVQRDPTESELNQIEILNAELNYPHALFAQSEIKTTRKGVPLPMPVDHGLGVLSIFPFTTESIPLTKGEGDKEQRIIVKNDFRIGDENIIISNIHFSNSDMWAEAQLKEIFRIFGEKNIKSILAGDFNIKKLHNYKELYGSTHVSSSEWYNYISYKKDNVSYDYIMIPRDYSFESFECKDESISDHCMLVSTIAFP